MKKNTLSIVAFLKAHQRTAIIIAATILLAGVIIGYTLWSRSSWDAYETRYSEWQSDVKGRLEALLGKQAPSLEDQMAKLQDYKELSGMIASKEGDICQVEVLLQWQRPLFQLKEREERCQSIHDKIMNFKTKLDIAVSYLQSEADVGKVIAQAPHSDKEVGEKEWSNYVSGWKAATDATAALSVSSVFEPVKQKALEINGKIVASWEEVAAASQAKDKARYIKAGQQLSQAYDSLSEITDIADGHMAPVATEVETAYRTAF